MQSYVTSIDKAHWRFTLKTNIWSESEWIKCKWMIKNVAGWNWWNPKSEEFKEQKAIYELMKDHHGSMVDLQRRNMVNGVFT